MELDEVLGRIVDEVAPLRGAGEVADYIPALARIDPGQFGIAVADLGGRVVGAGDWQVPFSAQSISKVFTLALVLAGSDESLWRRVGREPSGNAFNSLVQLEHERGIPRNPFINAGALAVTDELISQVGDATGELLDFLRAESGNPDLRVDEEVAASEATHAHRNLAVTHFMASYGNMHNPVATVLDQYVRQCSIEVSCRDLALAGLFLAAHGVRRDGSELLTSRQAKRVNAIMLTCGTYDAAGDFAYRVGIPGKSGVGGGVLAIVPGRCSIAVWSPGLDARGNSVTGVAALDHFTNMTGWSIF
ncbi:glutaminase [Saccharopolyspora rhizosphaerae]|uniref:Glutaminase n=1 Tax=Saccharopolyspora rhizosphaerae TaxID=2492662 RepID=A0A426JYR6_9PSEU|nr:glutaminase [Saccharopolyspora rhizosphaerae]RRO18313.1 glutaminase [Saccharopolyspora rhizosphaerae]